jgi:voltage-gated potassium channel
MHAPPELPHLGPLRLPESSPVRALIRRALLALGLIATVVVVLWLDREGLRDHANAGDPLDITDVLYFTVVSLTTLGYGDISPVTWEARLLNVVLLTPIRVFLWVLFLGTAYEMSVLRLRLREERYMANLHDRLRGHVIICDYGVTGRSIVTELIAHGHSPANMVVIDLDENATAQAAKDGAVALRGDASSEALLKAAAVDKAGYVLVSTNRDDTAVLICLTVRHLAPTVKLVAAAREEENVKLLYGAGANLVVASAVSGGRLMASAVHQQAVPKVLENVLSFGEGLFTVGERSVGHGEAGTHAFELPDLAGNLILGVVRDGTQYPFPQLREFAVRPGDVVVYLVGSTSSSGEVPDAPPDRKQ